MSTTLHSCSPVARVTEPVAFEGTVYVQRGKLKNRLRKFLWIVGASGLREEADSTATA